MTNCNLRLTAREIADDLHDAGARFTYRASVGALPPSFIYELSPGGDRRRCRRIIAEVKGDPVLWSQLVSEISLRCAARVAGDCA